MPGRIIIEIEKNTFEMEQLITELKRVKSEIV